MKLSLVTGVAVVIAFTCLAPSAGALPPVKPQPGQAYDPADGIRAPALVATPRLGEQAGAVAQRNFLDASPGIAITGGLFNDFGVPGFFPYGTGAPGSGTGGWVASIAHP